VNVENVQDFYERLIAELNEKGYFPVQQSADRLSTFIEDIEQYVSLLLASHSDRTADHTATEDGNT
jgi:hypothetical protein